MAGKGRILVTGGCGYIGSVLVRRLAEDGHHPVAFDLMIHGDGGLGPLHPPVTVVAGDIRDLDAVRAAAAGCGAAVLLAGVSLGNEATAEGAAINRAALAPLLACLAGAGVRRVVYASSCSVYGEVAGAELDEDAEPHPISEYGAAKLAGEQTVLRAAGLEPVILRAATVCGVSPRQRLDLLVNRMTRDACFHRRIAVESADSIRPSVHIRDLADIYSLLATAAADRVAGRIFNAAFENRPVMDTALAIAAVTGAEVHRTGLRVDDRRSYAVASRRLAEVLGYVPRRTVAEAVAELLAWFADGRMGVDAYAPRYDNRAAERAWFASMPASAAPP